MVEVIVKYNGNIYEVGERAGALVEELFYGYAILTLEESKVSLLYDYSQIEYVEMPKMLELLGEAERNAVCVYGSGECENEGGYFFNNECLNGKGVIVAVIDSGIDYRNADFINPDGTTRILYIYDLSGKGENSKGIEYSQADINNALFGGSELKTFDYLGHGTAVASICSGKTNGIAPKADIIAVKLGENAASDFARSTNIMRAVKYAIEKAEALKKPVSINLSFGTNFGAHNGNSVFEQFMDMAAGVWKNVICVPTGNEGNTAKHYSGNISDPASQGIEIVIGSGNSQVYIVVYKDFSDEAEIEITAPNGEKTGRISQTEKGISKYNIEKTDVYVSFSQPSPYNVESDFLIELRGEIAAGIWQIGIYGVNILKGDFNIWLPVTESSPDTRFLNPSPEFTLTIPSTARNVVSIAGIDTQSRMPAVFSGRGFINDNLIKPDIAAPSVNVSVGTSTFSGTSFAAPFAAGTAAVLMQWGIVNGNDKTLYGQRLKAFLRLGASRNQSGEYPNAGLGFGILCAENTLAAIRKYI